jgi:hypothetical protein
MAAATGPQRIIRIRFNSCARPDRGMGLGSPTHNFALGVPFQPMYHRQDADATESDAHRLFRIRITGFPAALHRRRGTLPHWAAPSPACQGSLGSAEQHPAYARHDRPAHPRRAAEIHDPSPGLLGEVQTGEFPVQFDRLAVVGPGRLGRIVEHSDTKRPALMPDLGLPLVSVRIDAAEPRNSGAVLAIDVVLPQRGMAEIDPMVVQAVAVLMVHHHALGWIRDHPVHEAQLALAVGARIERSATGAHRPPGVPAEPVIVRRIDQRTQPVHVHQRNEACPLPRPLRRPDPLPKSRAPLPRLDRRQPAPALLPIGADQQRPARLLDRHGKPAIAATALAAVISHGRRRSYLVARRSGRR